MKDETHTLYRFYGSEERLLYIGISANPWTRFKQHRDDKPWWDDIVRITMEKYPSREAVLEAERLAIAEEKPQHNVMHNNGRPHRAHRKAADEHTSRSAHPLAADQAVVLCMSDGTAPVGYIEHSDDHFVTLWLKSWITGNYDLRRQTVRVADIVRVHHCRFINGAWDDHSFADIQSKWIRTHSEVPA